MQSYGVSVGWSYKLHIEHLYFWSEPNIKFGGLSYKLHIQHLYFWSEPNIKFGGLNCHTNFTFNIFIFGEPNIKLGGWSNKLHIEHLSHMYTVQHKNNFFTQENFIWK